MSFTGRYLVLGLGNPGASYSRSRHNTGVWALDELRRRHHVEFVLRKNVKSLVAEVNIGDKSVVLAFPQTFMNNSGVALTPLSMRYSIGLPEGLIVVHDELDLMVGTVKVKQGGGLAGHNGLRSIAHSIGTHDFTRVRIGIDRPVEKGKVMPWVLGVPSKDEAEILLQAAVRAADAVEDIVRNGPRTAMNAVNGGG